MNKIILSLIFKILVTLVNDVKRLKGKCLFEYDGGYLKDELDELRDEIIKL